MSPQLRISALCSTLAMAAFALSTTLSPGHDRDASASPDALASASEAPGEPAAG